MTDPTLSQICRTLQTDLSTINVILAAATSLSRDIGLAPFRTAHLEAAMQHNQHAWEQLNQLATALELTGADHKP